MINYGLPTYLVFSTSKRNSKNLKYTLFLRSPRFCRQKHRKRTTCRIQKSIQKSITLHKLHYWAQISQNRN